MVKKIIKFIIPQNGGEFVGASFALISYLASIFLEDMAPSKYYNVLIGMTIFLGPYLLINMIIGYLEPSKILYAALNIYLEAHKTGVLLFTFLYLYYLSGIDIFENRFINDFIMIFIAIYLVMFYKTVTAFVLRRWV